MPKIKLTMAAARVNVGMTQKDAAKKLGISRELLVAIENGKRKVKPTELMAMAMLYGIPVDVFSLPDATT